MKPILRQGRLLPANCIRVSVSQECVCGNEVPTTCKSGRRLGSPSTGEKVTEGPRENGHLRQVRFTAQYMTRRYGEVDRLRLLPVLPLWP